MACLGTFSAVALLSSVVGAEVADQPAADQLFDEALELMRQGKHEIACPKLVESQRMDPGTGTLLYLGECYERTGKTASAWSAFKLAIAAAHEANQEQRERVARERAQALVPKLPRLLIMVPDGARVDGLVVKRDSSEVGSPSWGVAIPVDPGQHQITATAPNHNPWAHLATVKGEAMLVSVTVPRLEPTAKKSSVSPKTVKSPAFGVSTPTDTNKHELDHRSVSTQRSLGFVAIGIGGIGLLGGGIAGSIALLQRRRLDEDGCVNHSCFERQQSDVDDYNSMRTVSAIAFAAGVVGVMTGVTLLVASSRQTKETPRITSWIGPGTIALRGGF